MHRLKQGCVMALAFCCWPVFATGFVSVGAGWSTTDINPVSKDATGWRASVGYSIHPQWDVEVGYLSLLSGKTIPSGAEHGQISLDADVYYLGLLGKAGNETGELFYRVGVGQANVASQPSEDGDIGCNGGSGSIVDRTNVYCGFDESYLAMILGLGFDYYFTDHLAIRFEGDYLFGENDTKSTKASVSLKVFF